MIVTLTMNPAIDKTAELEELQVGELNRLCNVQMDAGGKGINVSKTIKALHKESICMGLIAGNAGRFIAESLDSLSIKHKLIAIEGNTRTNLKVLDRYKNLTELNESGPVPNAKELDLMLDSVVAELSENDILVISGSVPKGVPCEYYETLIARAKQSSAKVILDADGELFKYGVQAQPNVIKPNKFELCQYFDTNQDIDDLEVVTLARRFITSGVELVAVSMGSEGAIFVSEKQAIRVRPLTIKPHSSVGAGDAMVAAIACALEDDMVLEELVSLAVATSAGAVTTQGTKPATYEDVQMLRANIEYYNL